MTDRKTAKRRLERAGFVHISGWVPAAYGARVAVQVDAHKPDVAVILAEEPKPRGWPKGKPRKVLE
jgi:hypothetical protein